MSILTRLFEIVSNTPEVKEAGDFNLTDTVFIEEKGVAYGLSYQDNGNGSSKVKLLISPLYQSKAYEWDTGTNIANEFKCQLSLISIKNSTEVDTIGVIFPEEETNKEGEKYVKGLTFNTYKIKQLTNTPLVEYSGRTKLQKNANNSNYANIGNSYSQPKAAKVNNSDIIVIAHNLKDQTLVSWYLKPDKDGKFKALRGKKGIIERKLFKFDNPGQLVLDGNTMLYAQMSKKITEVRKTHIFKFDVAKVVQNLKDGKEIDECLLKKNCQIGKQFLSSKHEISFLQHIKQTEGNDLVAFLAEDQSSNIQRLHLTNLVKNGLKSNFTVCECEDPIEQLYVKNNSKDSFIITAVSGENIITFNHKNSETPHKLTIIPANSIKTLSDFVNIINGRLTPGISSSTVAPITTTETVAISEQASTAAITGTTKTDAVKTTQPLTEPTIQTSTIEPTTVKITATPKAITVIFNTKTSSEKPTTADETTVTSQAATVTTEADKTSAVKPTTTEPTTTDETPTASQTATATTEAGTHTPKSTTATISLTSAMSSTTQSLTEPTTQTSTVSTEAKPTIEAETTDTSKATIATIMSTNVPTTNSEETTQTVFIIPSTGTKELTTPVPSATSFTQSTLYTQPTKPNQRAIAGKPNEAGIIAGSVLGAVGFIGIIGGFTIYKYVKEYRQHNAVPVLELADLDYGNQSHSNSNEELFISNSRTSSPEIALNSVSVENSSQSSSSSPGSSRSSESM